MSSQYRAFGKKWFRSYPRSHYHEEYDASSSFTSIKAFDKTVITSGNMKYAFIKDGFIDRNLASEKQYAPRNMKHQIVTREFSSTVTKFQKIYTSSWNDDIKNCKN